MDSTGTGEFASGAKADVTTQVPGVGGNILPDGNVPRGLSRVFARFGLHKRAQNVNKDYVCLLVSLVNVNIS